MTLIYGHRDAKDEAPENTLTGFQRCLEHGVNRCELDLHLPRDSRLMVIHDPTLKRTTDRRGKVAEHGAVILVTYDVREGDPGWMRPTPIPRLKELFEKCPFEHWQPEVKSASRKHAARTVTRTRESTERFGNHDRITITSDSWTVLKALNRLAPELPCELVTEYAWLDPLKAVQHYGCALLALSWTLCTLECLLRAQRQGLRVSVWTVDGPVLVRRLADFGMDSLIADFPGLASAIPGNC